MSEDKLHNGEAPESAGGDSPDNPGLAASGITPESQPEDDAVNASPSADTAAKIAEPAGDELTPEDFIAPDEILNASEGNGEAEVERDTHSINFFKDLLRKSHTDDAAIWITNHDFSIEQINITVNEVFHELVRYKKFPVALEVGRKFSLSNMVIEPLYLAEWSRLCEERQYEDAAIWAKEQGMSAFDITRAGNLAFEYYLKNDELDDSIRMLREYKLDKENLVRVTIPEFNRALKNNEYYRAAVLGREFNFSPKRTNVAAIKAMLKALKNDDFDFAVDINYRFGLISDAVFDAVGEKEAMLFKNDLISHFSAKAFKKGRLNSLKKFLHDSSLMTKVFSSNEILEFKEEMIKQAIGSHNSFLKSKDAGSGHLLVKMFNLFTTAEGLNSFQTVIEEAFIYHNDLLRNGHIEKALEIKEEYNLLTQFDLNSLGNTARQEAATLVVKSIEKGDLKASKRIIAEYRILPEMIEDALFKSVFALIGSRKYKEAVSIINDFENSIRKSQLKDKLILMFKRLSDAKEYILAADFAISMDLERDYVIDAASRAWLVCFKSDKHEAAFEIKRRYKIPKQNTVDAASKAYWLYIHNKDYEMAAYVRKSYRVPITLTQWFMEFFGLIFKK